MGEDRFNPLQGGWLALDSANTPMHLGGLLYFTKPRGADADFVPALAQSMRAQSALVAPWNCRLNRLGRLARQVRWETDPQVDLDYHFRHSALPAPGGERELGVLVSRLHGHPLDLDKPPWECHLIEGLHDDQFALYIKLHAALLDGPAVVEAVQSFLAGSARAKDREPLWCQPVNPAPAASLGLEDIPAAGRTLLRRLRGSLLSAAPWGGARRPPRSALNARLGPQRRIATQSFGLARLRAAADAMDSGVDEVLYFLCGSAIRRFFREYNALPDDPLIAVVADRSREDALLSPLFISLGTQHADRGRRLTAISRSLGRARRALAKLPAAEARVDGLVATAPYVLRQLAGVDHRLPPLFNLGIAQFSASDKPLYLKGARLKAIYPIPMLLEGGALNIAWVRYAGSVDVGLVGARENLPHLQRLAVYMSSALEDLEAEIRGDE